MTIKRNLYEIFVWNEYMSGNKFLEIDIWGEFCKFSFKIFHDLEYCKKYYYQESNKVCRYLNRLYEVMLVFYVISIAWISVAHQMCVIYNNLNFSIEFLNLNSFSIWIDSALSFCLWTSLVKQASNFLPLYFNHGQYLVLSDKSDTPTESFYWIYFPL